MISECARDLKGLENYQTHGRMESLRVRALAGAMFWMEEQRRELEEQQRRVQEWEGTIKGLISL
ncbi:hypothetical protein TWF281_006521 [Arthrobotrys megalospora]